jgi:hypothetical protein
MALMALAVVIAGALGFRAYLALAKVWPERNAFYASAILAGFVAATLQWLANAAQRRSR